MTFDLNLILRENIKQLVPYSSARSEYKGGEALFLDANENSFGVPLTKISSFNRYPDPLQLELKEKISSVKGIPAKNIFVGNGSDEAIDLLIRAFCRPSQDNILVCPPTYGMYETSAGINDVNVKKVNLLKQSFQLNVQAILDAIDPYTRLLFICNPNNPTGNNFQKEDVLTLLTTFPGIVVIDEAYINYSSFRSFIPYLTEFPNLVILQTLSKAWGLAGLRVGMAFASFDIVEVFNKIKPPYNVNTSSQELAIKALANITEVNEWIVETVKERKKLATELGKLKCVLNVYPSETNFLLVKVTDANDLYRYLVQNNIVVRNRTNVELCGNCIRITVGKREQNVELIKVVQKYGKQ